MAVPKLRFKEFLGDWSKSTLGNISEIFDGTHQTPKYVDSGVKFVSVENINDLYSTDKYITKDAFDADFKNKPRANDILMTRITAGEIGATAIVKNDEPLGYYVSLALIRPNNYCLSGYLNQYISTNIFKNELHKRIIHTAFPKKINLGDINDCEVSYPSKEEQIKIANFLTAMDEKISQLNEQHQLMIQYKKGVMQKIFSQEIRFKDDNGEEFGEWEEKKLSEIAYITTGSSNREDSHEKNGMYTFFDRSEDIRTSNKYLFDSEALIIGGEGSIFKPKYFVGKFDLHQRAYAIMEFKNIVAKYLFYFIEFNHLYFLSVAVGTTVKSLRLPMFENMPVKLPSVDEQFKIADFLTAIDKRIENLARQLEQAKIWKKGLLQQMFV